MAKVLARVSRNLLIEGVFFLSDRSVCVLDDADAIVVSWGIPHAIIIVVATEKRERCSNHQAWITIGHSLCRQPSQRGIVCCPADVIRLHGDATSRFWCHIIEK